jgi:hypothetical protein
MERDMDTPQRRRRFAQFMVVQQQQWRAGDPLALSRAILACSYDQQPLPRWLRDALLALVDRSMTKAERRMYRELEKHRVRWRVVRELRQRSPKPLAWERCWEEAAKMLRGGPDFGSESAIQDSHSLIQRSGGERTTLESYRRAVQEQHARRKKAKHKATAE